jgi:hypothetical protein
MIGTTFKLGFDGSSVSRGLGRITGGMMRGFGRIGVGALERVGHRVTDLMGRIVLAIPQTLKETADWAGGLTDMATATGMSVEELVILEEKFRLAGVSAKESGAVVSRFALNLKTAATEGGAAVEALRAIGFDGQFIKGKSLGEAFDQIAKTLAIMGPELDNVEGIMSDLFGAKLGYQQLKLFMDFAAVTKQAENNVGKLAVALGSGQAAALDKWSDAMGRFENFKRSLSTIALDEIFNITGGGDGINSLFDTLDPEKFRPKIRQLSKELRNTFLFFREGGGMGEMLVDFGKLIGKGITDSIKESFQGGFSLKNLFMPGAARGNPKNEAPELPELKKQTVLLQQIRDESNTARFA